MSHPSFTITSQKEQIGPVTDMTDDQRKFRLHTHTDDITQAVRHCCFGLFVFLQMIIEQLEEERKAMAGAIAETMREHQQLLQVKMDLGMEVSAYR